MRLLPAKRVSKPATPRSSSSSAKRKNELDQKVTGPGLIQGDMTGGVKAGELHG
jgi:hypothetical protein